MPRLMSVSMTTDAVRERRKTVTRRAGWEYLKPGDRLTLCAKVQGRRKGEPLDRIVDVEVVDVTREPLYWITSEDVAREGFPGMSPAEFVTRFFVEGQHMTPSDMVTRIEFKYIEDGAS